MNNWEKIPAKKLKKTVMGGGCTYYWESVEEKNSAGDGEGRAGVGEIDGAIKRHMRGGWDPRTECNGAKWSGEEKGFTGGPANRKDTKAEGKPRHEEVLPCFEEHTGPSGGKGEGRAQGREVGDIPLGGCAGIAVQEGMA